MIIETPISAHWEPQKDTSLLFFDGDRSARFIMRAAVAWPEGNMDGFAILAGQKPLDKTIMLFEELRFMTIEHWMGPDGELIQEGLAGFLNKCWSKYFCRTIFYHQAVGVHDMHFIECIESPMIQPLNLEFCEVDYAEEETSDLLIDRALKMKRLVGDSNSELYRDLKDHRSDIETRMGVHALRVLLAGYEYWKWQDYKPIDNNPIEVYWR